MSFETTIRAFTAALDDPSAAAPPMTRGRMGAPDARRFAVYRNNVAVGLIGALEARYPVSRQIAGEDLFRATALPFVRAQKPRSPVMIAYGAEFPEFVAEYLTRAAVAPGEGDDAPGGNRHREERSDAAIQESPAALRSPGLLRFARNDEVRSTRRIACLVDAARLENAWVEAYHAEDASVATVAELAALSPDCLPGTRIVFHPAARLLRFATPAASLWASAQNTDQPAAPLEGAGEDALITRPDCDVRVRVLPPLAHDFALSLRDGASLIEAAAAMNDPAFDFGTHLVGLVESGAVASIVPGQPS
jgi:Putative DNA-binding domain